MSTSGELSEDKIRIYTIQKTSKRYFTTIEGLDQRIIFDRLLSDLKSTFGCGGTVKRNKYGKIIQLDFHNNDNQVEKFLYQARLARPDQIESK